MTFPPIKIETIEKAIEILVGRNSNQSDLQIVDGTLEFLIATFTALSQGDKAAHLRMLEAQLAAAKQKNLVNNIIGNTTQANRKSSYEAVRSAKDTRSYVGEPATTEILINEIMAGINRKKQEEQEAQEAAKKTDEALRKFLLRTMFSSQSGALASSSPHQIFLIRLKAQKALFAVAASNATSLETVAVLTRLGRIP